MNILTKYTQDKGNTPRDILMIRKTLEAEGIDEYEKNTLNFLSEFINTYIVDVLSDAKTFASSCERGKINIEDVKLAIKMRQENMCIKRTEVNKLKELAQEVNSIPLPQIPDTKQILLPPQEHSLTRNNFQIYTEDLISQINVNLSNIEMLNEKNDKLSERALQPTEVVEDGVKSKGLKRDEEVSRPVQTVLRRKKNREVKISLELNKDRKKEVQNEEITENVINFK